MLGEDPDAAYERGVTAGDIAARLAGHEARLGALNGNLARMADEMAGVKMALQRLADQAEGRDTTATTTAKALDKANTQRWAAVERSWSPVAKLATGIGILVGILGVIAFFIR